MVLKKLNIVFYAVILLALPFYAHGMHQDLQAHEMGENSFSAYFRCRLTCLKTVHDEIQQDNDDLGRNQITYVLSSGLAEEQIEDLIDQCNASKSERDKELYNHTQELINKMVNEEKEQMRRFMDITILGSVCQDAPPKEQDENYKKERMRFFLRFNDLKNHCDKIDTIVAEVWK